jgi:hypothetical protein
MVERQKRLKEVYEHLRRWSGIHTQTDFANSMRYSRNAISLALNGNEKYLTDKLFTNVCEAFPGVFNLDYLLTGEGTLLMSQNLDAGACSTDMACEQQPSAPIPSWADAFFDIMSQQIKQNESLVRELHQAITEVNALKSELATIIEHLKS